MIDVSGKTILPGFIDGHCHWEDFCGELYLHLGITTCCEIETQQNGPWSLAQKEGTRAGKIRGPRIWTDAAAASAARETSFDAEGSRALARQHQGPDAGRAAPSVQQKKKDGYDVIKLNEFLTTRIWSQVVIDEAHRSAWGSPAIPGMRSPAPRPASTAIEHIWSVGYSSIDPRPARNATSSRSIAPRGKIDAGDRRRAIRRRRTLTA